MLVVLCCGLWLMHSTAVKLSKQQVKAAGCGMLVVLWCGLWLMHCIGMILSKQQVKAAGAMLQTATWSTTESALFALVIRQYSLLCNLHVERWLAHTVAMQLCMCWVRSVATQWPL